MNNQNLNLNLLIFLLFFIILIFYFKNNKDHKKTIKLNTDVKPEYSTHMLNNLINPELELSKLLLPVNSTSNILNQRGGSIVYKDFKLNDNNLDATNINYDNYSSYRKKISK